MEKVRWGVIGCGGIARLRTIPGMLRCDNAELISVMDLNMEVAQAVKEQFGAKRAYDNAAELLKDDDIDAVYIATPVFTHAPLTRQAADAGKHILCEKPLGLNAEEA
ncbi:MAG: Gfo/Idh/MocA family oxidoreductase, partial [Lachnospiraceae bacterium]|nr:Gfo/Idh/MocA family oxidoreductase [Lachnospiraceae bacterium]